MHTNNYYKNTKLQRKMKEHSLISESLQELQGCDNNMEAKDTYVRLGTFWLGDSKVFESLIFLKKLAKSIHRVTAYVSPHNNLNQNF